MQAGGQVVAVHQPVGIALFRRRHGVLELRQRLVDAAQVVQTIAHVIEDAAQAVRIHDPVAIALPGQQGRMLEDGQRLLGTALVDQAAPLPMEPPGVREGGVHEGGIGEGNCGVRRHARGGFLRRGPAKGGDYLRGCQRAAGAGGLLGRGAGSRLWRKGYGARHTPPHQRPRGPSGPCTVLSLSISLGRYLGPSRLPADAGAAPPSRYDKKPSSIGHGPASAITSHADVRPGEGSW
ncbi:hypothetical protein AZA_89675 [Nitrospirillum viridazoti Y2]|nr:hypothetical protein AZA_89675 [Nitrospirillum amazonense Y2]